jgi:beta-galactosidase GanA
MRAVFLGYPVVLTQPVADALKAYVAAGGTLISEARPAATNERGQQLTARTPGAGLDEVFGARTTEGHQTSDIVTMTADERLDGPLASMAGRTLHGEVFADHLEPTRRSTRVLARYRGTKDAPGHPAIVMSEYGSGRAILMSSLPAAAFDANPTGARASGDLLAALVALAGVTPDVRIEGTNGLVETRYLESSDVIMLIGLNHTSAAQTVTFRFAPDTQEAIWQNMVSGTAVNFVATPEGPRYTHTIGPKDALVLMIRKHMR